MDERLFRNTMGKFATGVTVITTKYENETVGMTANAFVSVSLDPKLVLISVANKARTLGYIQNAKEFAVSFLSDQQKEVSMRFAGQLKEDTAFEFFLFNQLPVIKDALAAITCNLYAEYEAGDHTLLLGEVTDVHVRDGDPLLFFQGKYRSLQSLEEISTL
ncbi:flavin reductase family protein [Neobacillus sp. FSL H8-0543]|uniref:flavin reductase family protein n=1 Tax=Neobacillus sp. FSL H8-0543 TaxID=2954672 RepID=UPI003158E46B